MSIGADVDVKLSTFTLKLSLNITSTEKSKIISYHQCNQIYISILQ